MSYGDSLKPPCLFGLAAALGGEPVDACRYRRADRRNAWVWGWHKGEHLALEAAAVREARRARVGA
ncbi:MAG: hypothetical protein ACREXW_01100 [Gammaproteobacteria bacterium]